MEVRKSGADRIIGYACFELLYSDIPSSVYSDAKIRLASDRRE